MVITACPVSEYVLLRCVRRYTLKIGSNDKPMTILGSFAISLGVKLRGPKVGHSGLDVLIRGTIVVNATRSCWCEKYFHYGK